MPKYNTILFDLDGTLTDSSPGIINSIIYVLNKYNMPKPDYDVLRKFLGPPLHESFKEYFSFDEEKTVEAVGFYREYFSQRGIFENNVYDGVINILSDLQKQGRRLIVATSKPQIFTDRILDHFDLTKYFELVVGSDFDGTRSKKSEVIEYALESCGVTDKSSVVMIGDRKHDILGAQIVGIDSIGVEYGYGSYDELKSAGATYIAKTTKDLYKLLLMS